MRALSLSGLLLFVVPLAACAATDYGSRPTDTPGGSATDIDRGAGAIWSPETGTPMGSQDTIGAAPLLDQPGSEIAVPPSGNAIAAPPAPALAPRARLSGESVRELQRALSRRGYYQGEISGAWDAQLADALGRFQLDHHLPATNRLDSSTARALSLPYDIAPDPTSGPPPPIN